MSRKERFYSFLNLKKENFMVFLKAISNGGIYIVPRAYISSGKKFPAQVKFTKVWHCDPLFEDEFCDAIQDNYFSTYKFNFGLSKNQVQSLMRLFKSRKCKVEVPRSIRYNKRKKREWDCKSIKESQSWKGSLSPDSCRKYESIHFNDDAYDPGHDESDELLTLQQKKGNNHVSSTPEETELYIPLCSPDDDSDTEQDEEIDLFSECFGMFVRNNNRVPSIPVPQFLLSDLQSKDGINNLKSPLRPKAMYADKVEKRTSVFDRLNYSSKIQNDVTGKEHKNGIEDCSTMCSRGTRPSVFMRSTGATSHAETSQLHCMTDDRTGGDNW